MVRIDARLAIGGTIMIIAGIALSIHLESTTPVGMHGMSNEEIDDLLFEQRISGDIGNLVAILLGVGLLLLLLSFGTKIPENAVPTRSLPPLHNATRQSCINSHHGKTVNLVEFILFTCNLWNVLWNYTFCHAKEFFYRFLAFCTHVYRYGIDVHFDKFGYEIP